MAPNPAPYAAPMPNAFTVAPDQRERAVGVLQERYAQGVLSHHEFTDRVEMALGARTIVQLNMALAGLGGAWAARPKLLDTTERGRTGRVMGSLAHASALGTSFVGPAFFHVVSPQGSFAKHEAAKAFNFQLVSAILFAAAITGVATSVLPGGVIPLGGLAWFVLTLLGAVRAAEGERVRNPLMRVVPLRVLDEGPQRSARQMRAIGR